MMALIEEAIVSHLKTDATLNARLVNRIYPSDAAPQGLFDGAGKPPEFLTYRKIGGGNENHQGGRGGLQETLLHITAYAPTAKAASELMEMLRLRCDGVRAVIGTGATQATVRWMELRDPESFAEQPIQGLEQSIFRDAKDLRIMHVVPTS